MITPDELVGADVRARRETAGLSRRQFTELAGFAAQARIGNIEAHDSWKDGDREAVARVLNGLEDGSIRFPGRTTSAPSKPKTTGGSRARAIEIARAQRPGSGPLTSFGLQLARANELMTELVASIDGEWVQDSVLIDVALDDVELALPIVGPVPTLIDPARYVPPADDRSIHDILPRLGASVLDVAPGTYVLSNSEMSSWGRCQRQWWLAWYRNLLPLKTSATDARATGDRVHRALALYYVPDASMRMDPRDALERIIVEDWTTLVTAMTAANCTEEWIANQATEFMKANALERAMIEGYVAWLQESGADAEYEVLGSEQARWVEFSVPGNAAGDEINVRLIIRQDAQIRRKTDGARLFVDHKTTASIKTLQQGLVGDPQMLTYHVVEWLSSSDNAERCVGALYNMLAKSKRTERAKGPFYERTEVRHNPHELENHLREIMTKARRIVTAKAALDAGVDHHDVVPRTWAGHCTYCDFRPICPMFDDGSRVEDAIAAHYVVGEPRIRYNDLQDFEPKKEVIA